jgi:HlyD family secretion protein
MKIYILLAILLVAAGAAVILWPKATSRLEGYIEADWVYVSAPVGGKLEALHVKRGEQVKAGAALFELEDTPLAAAEAAARARKLEAAATLELAQKNRTRAEELFKANVVSQQELDSKRTAEDEAAHAARGDEADWQKAVWNLAQTHQEAPADALVFDTLYRVGEQVGAGAPVVELLPPGAVYAKTFVPQVRLGSLKVGDSAKVWVDGRAEPVEARVRYIAPKAEYTPPVIYSRESRQKFVWKVELEFAPEVAAGLHPGEPVDVTL